jgi:hypothetical protein
MDDIGWRTDFGWTASEHVDVRDMYLRVLVVVLVVNTVALISLDHSRHLSSYQQPDRRWRQLL